MEARMRAYRTVLLFSLLLALATPPIANAHEKWFVEGSLYPVRWERLISMPVAVSLAISGMALLVLVLLRGLLRDPLFPNPRWLQPINPSVQAVLGIQTAISLVFMAVQGWLLAPTLPAPLSSGGFLLL